MKNNINKIIIGLFVNILIVMGTSCKKNEMGGQLAIRMTDAACPYDAVYVDIEYIQLQYDNTSIGDNGMYSLKTNSGVYNLLTYQNNVSVLLSYQSQVPMGNITQMRVLLGNNNSVVTGGISFPLTVPSGNETTFNCLIPANISESQVMSVLIDFNAAQSVVLKADGTYALQPVITIKSVSMN